MTVYVDHTHLGRRVTGIERITIELFSPSSLAPLQLTPITADGVGAMVMKQSFALPLRLSDPSAILLCPGFPPSPLLWPFAERVIPYIHDLFLMTRPDDLNARAKLYMAKPFKLAVKRYPRFLVNSADTARKLSEFCRSDAEIITYRPKVRNVFDVDAASRDEPRASGTSLRLVSIGTVEPRKNYLYGARILQALRQSGFAEATLEIAGRNGWGDHWQALERENGISLRGYCSNEQVRSLLQQADALLCTSHEEGLGLPLLEAQYAGLPVIAPDDAVFQEVLGTSGIFIDRQDPVAAARTIAAALTADGWRARFKERSMHNLTRWNALADADRAAVSQMISSLPASAARASRIRTPASGNNIH
jgi:glycosyltransferase involved in cell wall biosynthesis